MNDPRTQVSEGTLSGRRMDGLIRFHGIPYAAPPVGELRFAPPQPPRRWNGDRDASVPGPVAPQPEGPLRDPDRAMAEDCLHLDILTPSVSGERPVIVWLHGGGYFAGSSMEKDTDGARLAADHDIVVVSITHRLGLLGFLDLEPEGVAGSGNAGMLDIRAALVWIRANIGSFGGDPNRVTIAGHSGGGGKVSMLLAADTGDSLFQRAVIMAGPEFDLNTVQRARDSTRAVLSALGIRPDAEVLSRLRRVPTDELLHLQEHLGVGAVPGPDSMRFSPVIGRPTLPLPPSHAFAMGASASVPLILGTSRDEAHIAVGAHPDLLDDPWDEIRLSRFVADGLDRTEDSAEVLRRYRRLLPDLSARELSLDIAGDQFRIRTLRMAEARLGGGAPDTYVYRFDGRPGERSVPHGAEVAAFFGWSGDGSATRVLGSFARTGVPTEEWPRYTLDGRCELRIGTEDTCAVRDPDALRRTAWEGISTGPSSNPWARLLEPTL